MTSTDMGILAFLALIVLGFTVAALIIRADERDWRRQDRRDALRAETRRHPATTVNPLVGLALADLLDSLADDAEQFQPDDDRAAYGAPPRDELVLARLINGGA